MHEVVVGIARVPLFHSVKPRRRNWHGNHQGQHAAKNGAHAQAPRDEHVQQKHHAHNGHTNQSLRQASQSQHHARQSKVQPRHRFFACRMGFPKEQQRQVRHRNQCHIVHSRLHQRHGQHQRRIKQHAPRCHLPSEQHPGQQSRGYGTQQAE